jgi:hypothetical protein
MSRWASVAAAVLAMGMISACGAGESSGFSGSGGTPGKPITLAQFASLHLGATQAQIAKQFGTPESRQRVELAFRHEEPRKQRCIYYRRRHPDAGDPWNSSDLFQICFEGSRLRYKWAYIAARA